MDVSWEESIKWANRNIRVVLNYVFVGIGFLLSALFLLRNLYVISSFPLSVNLSKNSKFI